jgi:glycosidase
LKFRAAALFFGTLAAGCSAPPGGSALVVWYQAARMQVDAPQLDATALTHPQVLAGWDGWRPHDRWSSVGNGEGGWLEMRIALPPGTYQYALLLGETVLPDPLVAESVFVSDPLGRSDTQYSTEVSEVVLSDDTPLSVSAVSPGASGLEVSLADARGPLSAQLSQGAAMMAAPSVDGDRVSAVGLAPGKYTVTASDGNSSAAASAFVGESGQRLLGDGLIYQIMIDRFRGPNGALAPPDTPGDRAGGTLDGVRAAVEAGYFTTLGVTTLWLSPVYQNPTGKHVGRDGRLYEAYHGYWPSEPRTVEPQLGGEDALDRLIASAHARGLRVLFDAVPNHVYQSHPYYQLHSRAAVGDASWFNDGPTECVCGDPNCDWGTFIETCWFGPELPDLNWRDPDVVDAEVGDLLWWMQRFDLDGLRIDAVPMMPRVATRRIARGVRAQVSRRGLDSLILGEDYTGPGEEGRQEIRAYLDQQLDGLDSAFDFPLMWAARQAIGERDPAFGFDALEGEVTAGEHDWSGSGATMAHMLDNHDTTRFASDAAGDGGGDPWLAPPPQSTDPSIYARELIGLVFNLTLPGLPVIYYGDEIALAGAGDPDSRRVLPDVLAPDTLPDLSRALLASVQKLGAARQRCESLRRGERRVLFVDRDHDVALRGEALVVLSRSSEPASVHLSQPIAGRFIDLLSGTTLMLAPGETLPVPPLSAAIYVPSSSSCR